MFDLTALQTPLNPPQPELATPYLHLRHGSGDGTWGMGIFYQLEKTVARFHPDFEPTNTDIAGMLTEGPHKVDRPGAQAKRDALHEALYTFERAYVGYRLGAATDGIVPQKKDVTKHLSDLSKQYGADCTREIASQALAYFDEAIAVVRYDQQQEREAARLDSLKQKPVVITSSQPSPEERFRRSQRPEGLAPVIPFGRA